MQPEHSETRTALTSPRVRPCARISTGDARRAGAWRHVHPAGTREFPLPVAGRARYRPGMSEEPRTAGVSRRQFLMSSVAAAGVAVSLRYAQAATPAQVPVVPAHRGPLRNKWTWDRVAHGTHGTNCAGTCAFNVYIRNGIVWREEQQGMYGPSGKDVPDYGPRGCQKGLRHAKYMYGPQRILYPMKRVGERGERPVGARSPGTQATDAIADKFLDLVATAGPECVSYGSGTQMSVKLASYSAGLSRFANITGVTVPEFYSGVGDLPTGVYMTLGQVYTRRHDGGGLQVALLPRLDEQPGGHAHPGRALLLGGEVQRHEDHRDLAPSSRRRRCTRTLGEREAGHRHRARDGDGRRHPRGEAVRRPVHPASRPTCRSWCASTRGSSCARTDLSHRRQAGGARQRLLPVGRGARTASCRRLAPGLPRCPIGRRPAQVRDAGPRRRSGRRSRAGGRSRRSTARSRSPPSSSC